MLARRTVLAGGLALLCPLPAFGAPSAPAGGRVAFEVMRKGRRIGEHVVEFSETDGVLTARARAEMLVALGPVPLFRYRHSQTERWRGGRFESLETHTVENGKTLQVEAKRTDEGVRIEGGKGARPLLAADALPLTHWNRQSLGGPLFNPQDGKLMRLTIASRGPSSTVLANGRTEPGTRIALSGEQSIENWYDEAGAWMALRAKAVDGSVVEYRRL